MSERAYKHILSILQTRPLDINIETTNSCPLKCVFCCNRKIHRKNHIMDLDLFKKICLEYHAMGGGFLGLSSMQSDLFTDPLLLERLKFLRSYADSILPYTTNSLFLLGKYTDNEIKFILESLKVLQISIEGINKEDYKIMSGVDGFEKFSTSIHKIYEIINKNYLTIQVECYVRTYNKYKVLADPEFEKLKRLFHIRHIRDEFFSWCGSVTQDELPDGARLQEPCNLQKNENCASTMSTLAVQVDGRVVGCGCIDWNSRYVVGDCRNDTLLNIWKSQAAYGFRNAFELKAIPGICKNCGLYSSAKKAFSHPVLTDYNPTDNLHYYL